MEPHHTREPRHCREDGAPSLSRVGFKRCQLKNAMIGAAICTFRAYQPSRIYLSLRANRVGQPERCKIKYVVDMALSAYTKNLAWNDPDLWMPEATFIRAFKTILELYKGIVEDDWVNLTALGPEWTLFERSKRIKESRHTHPRVCGFCQADILNRHFQVCREKRVLLPLHSMLWPCTEKRPRT